MDKWRFDFKLTQLVPVQTAELIYNEAKALLEDTLYQSDKITGRASTFIIIVVTAMGGLIARIPHLTYEFFGIETLLDIGAMIMLVIISFLLIRLISPHKMHKAGYDPKEYGTKEFLKPEFPNPDHDYVRYILSLTEVTRESWQNNRIILNKRARTFRITIILLFGTFVTYFCLYGLLIILPQCL